VEGLNAWTFDFAKEKFGVDLNLEMTWMEIYDALRPHVSFIYLKSLVDEHLEDGDKGDNPGAKEIVDALLDNPSIAASIKGLNVNAINLKKTQKLKHEKFKMILSKYIGSIVSFDKKPSVLRPNRRSSVAIKGYKKDKRVNALVAVDTSGSITYYKEALEKSFSIILNYCDTVDILPFSEEPGQIIKDVKSVPDFVAGGGENFHILEPFKEKYDVIIVVSDLICDPPTFKENNVIYLSKNSPDWVKGRKLVEL
jgi:hypothetical protein